jgi:glycosyltransferase involved in cell wall biosynthesis
MKLSIIIPAHNEEANISEAVEKIEAYIGDLDYELVIIDDHSTDNTAVFVNKLSRKYQNIRLVQNLFDKGFAQALKTGFSNIHNDVVVPVMGDLCDDLSTLKKMLDKIDAGFDIVCGSRYIPGGARIGGSRLKGFFSRFVGKSLYYLLGLPTHDIANAFKMYRRKVIESVEINSRGFEISMEIPLKAYYLGFKITEVPTVWCERTKGKSSFRMFKLFPAYLKLYLWAIFKKVTVLKKNLFSQISTD